jgi:hypothetical protein
LYIEVSGAKVGEKFKIQVFYCGIIERGNFYIFAKTQKKRRKIILLLLLPFFGFAKYYPGSITLNDGTYKSGLLDVPLNSHNQTISFKPDRFGKNEKFSVNEVKEFDVSVDGGMVYFVTTYIGDLKKDNTIKRGTKKKKILTKKACPGSSISTTKPAANPKF